MLTDESGGDTSSWEGWLQKVGGSVIDKWSAATYEQPYQIQRLRIQALGSEGYYAEGQPGASAAPSGGGLRLAPGVMLLGGAAILVVLLLKD